MHHVWSGRPVGTHGGPHTVVNVRLPPYDFSASFFAQPQDEQDSAIFIWFLLLMQKKNGLFYCLALQPTAAIQPKCGLRLPNIKSRVETQSADFYT
jgi:hypothetical protein